MKNSNKFLISSLAFALIMPFTSSSIFAAKEERKETNVAYDNRNSIPDPGNPDDPDWAVIVPKTITFEEYDDRIAVDVEIVKKKGDLPDSTKPASVSVSSANGYKLSYDDNEGVTSELAYKLLYNDVLMTETNLEIGDLHKDKTKIEGVALLSGTAKKTGLYTDTLTYTVRVN